MSRDALEVVDPMFKPLIRMLGTIKNNNTNNIVIALPIAYKYLTLVI